MDPDVEGMSQMDMQELTEKDIDGASLAGRHPAKLTKQDLKFWLACRAISHTKLKTKAELVARVLEVSGRPTDARIVDPTPERLYLKRKWESLHAPSHTADHEVLNVTLEQSIQIPKSGWQRPIPQGISFDDININDYALNSGKRAFNLSSNQPRKKTCIRPETKGYRFFTEKYLYDIWCANDEHHIFFKSKCFPSQRKNEESHSIWCALTKANHFNVDRAQCTCVAGKSGYCNHVMALLYQISHFSKSATTIIPDDVSKTSMPMTWQKPRIEGVVSEPIMEVVVNRKARQGDFPCTLYEARTPAAMPNNAELLTSVQRRLAGENSRYGILMARNQVSDTAICRTQLGTWVPQGSPLSYQLALTEGDFHVDCNTMSVDRFQCMHSCIVRDMECYPDLPMCKTQPPVIDTQLIDRKGQEVLQLLSVDSEKSNAIEKETRKQAGSDKWWEERRLRITASKFGEVVSRQQRSCEKFVERLQKGPSSDKKIPTSLKHGRDYEHVGTRKYHRYMSKIGHKVEIRPSGLVVRQDYPHLGASPDGHVLDPVAHPHFGILEVKCPYKYRNVKPRDAAAIDRDFCLCVSKYGDLMLRHDHSYYCQVQGQMLLTGAKWCDFVVYTFKGLHVERVAFDDEFCGTMLNKLNTFYFGSYLVHAKM